MSRTISILGDSISTFEGCVPEGFAVFYQGSRLAQCGLASSCESWWRIVASHFRAEVLSNASYSGSLVEGEGFPAGCSTERIAALASEARQPDDVIVFMGINDYGWGGAAAQASGRGSAVPPSLDLNAFPCRVASHAGENTLKRFEESYAWMLSQIRDAYPETCVWCCTLVPGRLKGSEVPTHTWNLRGISMERYNDAIRDAAASSGCKVADIASYALDYEAVDGTHPTNLGMRQIASMVIAEMDEFATVDPSLFEGFSWTSEVICDERSCIGCSRARSTGNDWSCVCER